MRASDVDKARMVAAVKLTAINAHGVLVQYHDIGASSRCFGGIGNCVEEAKS
jgi:hypothetical protein